MLTKAGAKVLDFGLAKVHTAENAQGLTQATNTLTEEGVILGTLQYMAPEQLEGKEANARSDIFAFGAVVYEMATGKKAFEGSSRASVIAAILEREPPPISSLQSLTPPALDHVVRTCLAKDPDERRQTAHDVMLELKWIAEGGSQASGPSPEVSRRENREHLAWALAAMALLAALTLSVLYFRLARTEPRAIRFSILPPEKAEFGKPFAISPDGQRLALVAFAGGDVSSLWLRRLDSLAAQALAGTEGANHPFWSPDSRFIGFFSQGKLKRIDSAGGPAVTLCDAPDAVRGAWSGQGVIVFSKGDGPLYRVSAQGGTATPVTTPDQTRSETGHGWPHFLPDGRHFLYLAASSKSEMDSIYVGSLDSEPRKLLLSSHWMAAYAPGPQGHLLFLREGTLMAQRFDASSLQLSGEGVPIAEKVTDPDPGSTAFFSVSGNGVLAYWTRSNPDRQMVWFDRGGKQLGTIGTPGIPADFGLAPDGKRVAIQRGVRPNTDIWLLDLVRSASSRFTFDPATDVAPIWSPDGRRIAFSSNRDGTGNLYVKLSTGVGDEELLLKSSEYKFPSDWSRDGRFITYCSAGERTQWDIWILPLEGDRKPFLFLQTGVNECSPHFSPDGRWLAYHSEESGRYELYVRTFSGRPPGASQSGGKWQVSNNGGVEPRWRADGKELFYLENNKLMAVDVKTGPTFEHSVPKELFESTGFDYAVAPDGQRILGYRPIGVEQPGSLTVVVNWTELLKR
jgi:Tol biopolymer transport system component